MFRISTILAVVLLAACNSAPKEDASYCTSPKPGVITTVNEYCVVVQEDPVNPEIVREWNGQRVGFCCNGCIPRWDKMTDAQKQAALDSAIAKGKVVR
ncbi:MAG: hypothetical protein KDA22_01930 [Phycisphaerales bacterium]|nr:hypothetical protein [Phycisphaerales bacterium]